MSASRSLLVLAAAAALAACSSSHSSTASHSATHASRQPRHAASTPTHASPARPAGGALPAGLTGVWHKNVQGSDQKMALEPGQFRFYVDPADAATGRLAVKGSELTFSDSNTCSGAGTYRFTLSGSSLRLSPVGGDPCPRSAFVPGSAWTRSG